MAISWWHNISVDDFLIRGKVHKRIDCVPMRMGALHCCIPSEVKSSRNSKKTKDNRHLSTGKAQIVKAMFAFSVTSEVRPHIRIHTGSLVECIYALQSFGIQSDQIPVSGSLDRCKTKHHSKWWELCHLKEDSLKNHNRKFDSIIECPNHTDVLFGRGRPIMRHPGNAMLRSVVQSRVVEYANAKTKKETTDITWSVVRILKGKYGARFLKEENIESDGLGWVEVSNETARQKVRIAFRDLRTKITKSSTADKKTGATDPKTTNGTNCTIGKTKRKGDFASPDVINSSANNAIQKSSKEDEETDSSTSVFLGMDGITIKRQRRSHILDCGNHCMRNNYEGS